MLTGARDGATLKWEEWQRKREREKRDGQVNGNLIGLVTRVSLIITHYTVINVSRAFTGNEHIYKYICFGKHTQCAFAELISNGPFDTHAHSEGNW